MGRSREKAMSYDVFISYARADMALAHRLATDLGNAGYTVFVDMATLAAGASFAEELSRAIQDARFVLVLLSQAYVESRWAQQELRLAMDQELRMSSGAIKVIPIRLDDCEIPFLLRDKRAVDLRSPATFAREVERLVNDLTVLSRSGHADGREPTSELSGQRPQGLDGATAIALLSKLKDTVQAFVSTGTAEPAPPPTPRGTLRRTCFVVMPFGRADLDIVYEDFVRPVLEASCGLICERADDLFGSNVIMEDIRSSIVQAHIVLADLTGKNANVFYEVGIAHTVNRPVLLLAQSMDDVPFDLRHRRVLIYDYSPRGCKKLESVLAQHVSEMLRPEST
jgi:hypothetical protein